MDDVTALHHELAEQLSAAGVAISGSDLVLAAYQGEASLSAVLRGEPLSQPTGAVASDEMPHVFMESVQVTGFRGIGPQAAIRLQPKPSLTIFVGRNGSGKSSFAEAIEYTLTEDSLRWAQRPALFREGWRNLHHAGAREIELKTRLSSGTQTTVRRTWPGEATELTAATVATTQGGAALPPGRLPEWAGYLDRYRPFLSARDLERVITAKPSELYDAIAPILGLSPLVDADVCLQRERKVRDDRAKQLKTDFTELRARLGALDDQRAQKALVVLGPRPDTANLAELEALADAEIGTEDDRAVGAARRLGEEALPEGEQALAELAEAEAKARQLTDTSGAAAERIADLLRRALEIHRAEGDQPCPVCRVGTLDDSWRRQTEEDLPRLTTAAAATRTAMNQHAAARRKAEELVGDVRKLLGPIATALMGHLQGEATATNEALRGLSLDLSTWKAVVAAHATLALAAAEWLDRRRDDWRVPGAAIRRWVDAATVVRAEAAGLALLTRARTDLATATGAIRAERLGAFVSQSEHIWGRLRQESNVELHQVRMDGVNTSRRVTFPVAVDGIETNALSVMSQGELHALGLAVFLPRACADASPYRFVVIDDPVQSMDPSKIDGLAEVLREVAMTRQVLVFTHDDRLPEAIRRLGIEATVHEVTRREGSIVEIRKATDPASRYLDDAHAVAVAAEIPEEAKYLLVAGFCRSAIEAVAMDRYRTQQHRTRTPYKKIEESLNGAHTVNDRLSLALLGDVGRRSELRDYLIKTYGRWSADTVQAVARAVHGHRDMATSVMVRNAGDLVGKLR